MAIQETLSKILYRSGFSDVIRKILTKDKRFVLVMHGVASEFNPAYPREAQPHLCRSDMIAILQWLTTHFAFLSPSDFFETAKPGVLLTFDDGFANNHEVLLPILEDYNTPAIYFVTLQHILEPKDWLPATREVAKKGWAGLADIPKTVAHDFYDGMTVRQLQACARHPLITIGSHTLSHPFLSQCTDEALYDEIRGSKQILEEIITQRVDYFAYPTGDYDVRAIEHIRAVGYTAAFAVDPKNVSEFKYEVPRVGLYDADSAYLGMKLSGLHRRPIRAD